jgi:hypothetical protein
VPSASPLDGLAESAVAEALCWERHIVEVLRGLPSFRAWRRAGAPARPPSPPTRPRSRGPPRVGQGLQRRDDLPPRAVPLPAAEQSSWWWS